MSFTIRKQEAIHMKTPSDCEHTGMLTREPVRQLGCQTHTRTNTIEARNWRTVAVRTPGTHPPLRMRWPVVARDALSNIRKYEWNWRERPWLPRQGLARMQQFARLFVSPDAVRRPNMHTRQYVPTGKTVESSGKRKIGAKLM